MKLKSRPGKLQPLYIGQFIVIRNIGCNEFKPDLPVALQVHPVFYVLLLQWYMGDRMLPAAVEVNDEIEYILEKLVWHRGRPRHYLYLVLWAGYDESEDMWLPEAELGKAPKVLK